MSFSISKSGLAAIAAVLLVVIIVVGSSGAIVYFASRQPAAPTASPTPSPTLSATPTSTSTPNPTAPISTPTPTLTSTPTLIPTLIPTLTPTSTPTPTPVPMFDLATAITSGLVQASITGSNLQNVYIILNSNSDNSINITIPAGTVFNSLSASAQNMIALSTQNLILTPHGTVSRTFSAACINMHLDTPNGQNSFTVRTTPTSEDLIKLLNLSNFNSETTRIRQFAIWTITDNPTRYGYTRLDLAEAIQDQQMQNCKGYKHFSSTQE